MHCVIVLVSSVDSQYLHTVFDSWQRSTCSGSPTLLSFFGSIIVNRYQFRQGLDSSAAELSRRRRKMVTHQISAENLIRPGNRRRRNKVWQLAEFVGDRQLDNRSANCGLL